MPWRRNETCHHFQNSIYGERSLVGGGFADPCFYFSNGTSDEALANQILWIFAAGKRALRFDLGNAGCRSPVLDLDEKWYKH
jgi:hypothetical protein